MASSHQTISMRAVPVELRAHYETMGWWTGESLGEILGKGLANSSGVHFRVHSAARPYSGTFAEVELVARRLAAGLFSRGVRAGDVIAFQLPNWMEAAATFWASSLLGAVVVPIAHLYGPKEVGFILGSAKPRVFITMERFGRVVYNPEISADVPIVGVIGSSFDDLLDDLPMTGALEVDPADPVLIAFTSGTTRDPKGVIHTHQTLAFETRQLLSGYRSDRGRQLSALPVGHFIGMLGTFLIPVVEGTPVDVCDQWDPAKVIALMDSDGVAIGGGPPYFVTSLLDHPDFTPDHLHYLKYIGLGGSTVPAAVTHRLSELGIIVTRSYGSTEHPSITGSLTSAPEDKRLSTDGVAKLGVEIRLAADGEILSRGPDLCLGYTDPTLNEAAFDREGWYHTGDIGVIDDDGYLSITDRKSDIIIRGGENVSAAQVEDVLLSIPAIAEAVVVATTDARLGERVAAAVRIKPGQVMPSLADVQEHFARVGTARQKWPEELHEVDDFPRTPSGKVKKHHVRQRISE